MSVWIFLSGIIAPALFWTGYFYYKDRFQPEPVIKLGVSYIYGILTAAACVQFFRILLLIKIPDDPIFLLEKSRILFLLYSIFITGIVEELFKFLPFLIVALHFKDFDEITDGVIYSSIIALGFASYENFYYLRFLEGFALFGRAFASPLSHTIFASIWGYLAGKAKMEGKPLLKPALIGLALAALCHGLFNFLTTSPVLRIGAALLILGVWIWRIRVLEIRDIPKGDTLPPASP